MDKQPKDEIAGLGDAQSDSERGGLSRRENLLSKFDFPVHRLVQTITTTVTFIMAKTSHDSDPFYLRYFAFLISCTSADLIDSLFSDTSTPCFHPGARSS